MHRRVQSWLLILILVLVGTGAPARLSALPAPGSTPSNQEEEEDQGGAGREAPVEAKLTLAAAAPSRAPTRVPGPVLLRKVPDPGRRTALVNAASTAGGDIARRNGFGSSLRC